MIEKNFENFEKARKEMKEIIRKKLIDTQFVKKYHVIDVKYVNAGAERQMLIDSGAPKSNVSLKWFERYQRDAKVSYEDIKKKGSARRFRMGKTLYESFTEVTFLVVMKMDADDFLNKDVVAYVINSDEVNFLCGKETIKGWKCKVDFEDDKFELKEKG